MKKLFYILLFLVLISCNEGGAFFRGSIGVYPDGGRFWALIQNPDYSYIENARVLIDSSYSVGFRADSGGYLRDFSVDYGTNHFIDVDIPDMSHIRGEITIPSRFSVDSVKDKGDYLVIAWKPSADSMKVPPDSWRVRVRRGFDTLNLAYDPGVNRIEVNWDNWDEVIIDAIRYGTLENVLSGSVFAGVVRKKKSN